MARADIPVYKCDGEDCKSYCTLSPTESDHKNALVRCGWLVVGQSETTEFKSYCPKCKTKFQVVAETV